jgi:hypothetical protein
LTYACNRIRVARHETSARSEPAFRGWARALLTGDVVDTMHAAKEVA